MKSTLTSIALGFVIGFSGFLFGYACRTPPEIDGKPAAVVSAEKLQALAGTLANAVSDGIVTVQEGQQLMTDMRDLGQAVSIAVTPTGGIDWTLIGVSLANIVLGGGLGMLGVNRMPNRLILGNNPDPEVMAAAGLTTTATRTG